MMLPEEQEREEETAATLFLRALASPDDELMGEAYKAFLHAVDVRWGRRLRAAKALLAAAEDALDAAELAIDPYERRRQLQIFELCLAAARADC